MNIGITGPNKKYNNIRITKLDNIDKPDGEYRNNQNQIVNMWLIKCISLLKIGISFQPFCFGLEWELVS